MHFEYRGLVGLLAILCAGVVGAQTLTVTTDATPSMVTAGNDVTFSVNLENQDMGGPGIIVNGITLTLTVDQPEISLRPQTNNMDWVCSGKGLQLSCNYSGAPLGFLDTTGFSLLGNTNGGQPGNANVTFDAAGICFAGNPAR